MVKAENVEVAYATPKKQIILTVPFQENLTAEQAIITSGICLQFPEIEMTKNDIGIFSKPCQLESVLKAGDRVEIYRALIADPKEVRRRRAEAGKVMKKGAAAKA